MGLILKSNSFYHDEKIPKRYTGEGRDVSPEFGWENPPPGTVEYALVCEDPDAPRSEPWVHWVVYNIPASARYLPESLPKEESVAIPAVIHQGVNSWDELGYRGPLPPPGHGLHHYNFKLYALDKSIPFRPGITKADLEESIAKHVLEEASYVGTYLR